MDVLALVVVLVHMKAGLGPARLTYPLNGTLLANLVAWPLAVVGDVVTRTVKNLRQRGPIGVQEGLVCRHDQTVLVQDEKRPFVSVGDRLEIRFSRHHCKYRSHSYLRFQLGGERHCGGETSQLPPNAWHLYRNYYVARLLVNPSGGVLADRRRSAGRRGMSVCGRYLSGVGRAETVSVSSRSGCGRCASRHSHLALACSRPPPTDAGVKCGRKKPAGVTMGTATTQEAVRVSLPRDTFSLLASLLV